MTAKDDRSAPRFDFCSLPADALAERRALVRREIAPLVQARLPLPDGVAWELPASEGLRRRLHELAAQERACCGASLELTVRDVAPDRLRLEIRGPAAAAFGALGAGDYSV